MAGINLSIFKNTKNKDAALKFVKFMTSAETQTALGKPFSSLPVLKAATPNFTDNADEAKTFSDIYASKSKPLPLVPAEDQFESTVGKAMNRCSPTIATGGTVSTDDIKAATEDALSSRSQPPANGARVVPVTPGTTRPDARTYRKVSSRGCCNGTRRITTEAPAGVRAQDGRRPRPSGWWLPYAAAGTGHRLRTGHPRHPDGDGHLDELPQTDQVRSSPTGATLLSPG